MSGQGGVAGGAAAPQQGGFVVQHLQGASFLPYSRKR